MGIDAHSGVSAGGATRRGVWALGYAALGLVAGRNLDIPSAAWIGAALAALALAAASRAGVCRASLGAALVLLAGGWYSLRINEPGIDLLAMGIPGAPAGVINAEGVLIESPRVRPASEAPLFEPEPTASFRLALDRVEGLGRIGGRVLVRTPASGLAVRAGDRVRITGLYTPVAPSLNPGDRDARAWAAQEGDRGRLRVSSPDLVIRLDGRGARARWWTFRQSLRDHAATILGVDEPDETGDNARALVAALVLGRQDDAEIRDAFLRAGLAHVLAISGFHLVVMAGVAMFAARLATDLGRLRPLAIGALVLAYLLVVPAEAPVLRAGVVVLVMLAAEAAGRRYDRINLLAWTGVALLGWRPMDLWSPGWQLSFGLTGLLLWQGGRMNRRVWGDRVVGVRRRAPEWLAFTLDRLRELVSASLLCALAAAPVIAFHTGRVTPLAALASILVVPLVVPLMWAAFAALLAGLIAPGLEAPARAFAGVLADAVGGLVISIDAGSPTLFVPRMSLALTLSMLALVVWWIARGRWRDPRGWAAAAALAGWTAIEFTRATRLPAGVVLRVDTLAVGDGTCHLVRSGTHALLWDCGSLAPGAGERAVRAARALGAWRVGDAVLTHSNFDHYSGLAHAARAIGIRRLANGPSVERSAGVDPQGPMALALAELDALGITRVRVGAGDRLELGEVVIEFLSPPPGAPWEDNDLSLAAIVHPVGADRPAFLFTGDMQEAAITALRERAPGLAADAMEAPHHGSWREPAAQLVIGVDPEVVAQSTGPSRANDPRWERARRGRTWRCTATDGASWVEFRRDGSVRAGSFR